VSGIINKPGLVPVHAVTTKLHLFTVTLDVHQIQVKLLVKTFYYYISMTIFKGRRVTLSCAQGIVYIKVIEDLEAQNQVLLITPDTSC
jgi:hypothetical protein